MASLYTLLIYWGLVFAVVAVLSVTGIALTYLVSARNQSRVSGILGDVSVVGLCYLIVTSLVVANAFNEIDRPLLLGILALPVLAASIKFFRYEFKEGERRESAHLRQRFRTSLTPLAIYSAAALIPFYSFLDKFISKNFVLTSVSKFNADLGMYLQMSSNLVTHGFTDNGKVVGANVGALARFDHPGAQAAIAGKSQILGLLPHQIGIVSVSCLLALLGLCVHQILSNGGKSRSQSLYLIGAWVIVSPLVVEMATQFFYAQLLSVVIMLGFLCLCQRFLFHSEKANVFLICLLGVSAFVTSPEVAMMLMAIMFFPLCYVAFSRGFFRIQVQQHGQIVKATVLVLSLLASTFPFIVEEIQVLVRTAESGIAGWSSNVLSPIGWAGLSPGTYFSTPSDLEVLIGSVVVVGSIGLTLRFLFSKHQDLHTKLLMSIFLISLSILGTMAFIYGSSAYQTWKTALSITPFLILGLVAALFSWHLTKNSAILFAALLVGGGIASSSMNWLGITQQNFVNQDLISIAQSPEYRRIPQIDIDLGPKVETMTVISLLRGEVNLVSPSYFAPEGSPRRFGCLLTWRGKAEDLGLMNELIVRRGEYVIVGDGSCLDPEG
jgi:hypothetical protein